MRILCADHALAARLAAVVPDEGAGLVYAAPIGFESWGAAEDELTEVFVLTQAAVVENGPVVYIVDSRALIGRGAPLDAAVATGLLAGARAIAFERKRYSGYASLVATGTDVDLAETAEAVRLLLTTRASNGQPLMVGAEHLGAALP